MIRLLVNGTVLTQDDSLPVAQALAVTSRGAVAEPPRVPPEAIKDVRVLQTWIQAVRLTGRSLVT